MPASVDVFVDSFGVVPLATTERLLWIDTIFLFQAGAGNGVSGVRPSLFSTGMVAFVLMIGSTAAEALDDAQPKAGPVRRAKTIRRWPGFMPGKCW